MHAPAIKDIHNHAIYWFPFRIIIFSVPIVSFHYRLIHHIVLKFSPARRDVLKFN